MTAVPDRRFAPPFACDDALPAGLIGQLAEAVTFPPEPHARAVMVAGLTAEIFETLRWVQGSDPDREELASLYRVLAEAYAHRGRMADRIVVGLRR